MMSYQIVENKIISIKNNIFIDEINPWSIHTITNPNDSNKILFCIPGFSESSYTKVIRDINLGLRHIDEKYKHVIILKFGDLVKQQQNERLRNPINKLQVENQLYKELGYVTYKILNLLRQKYTNFTFDILGKSAGCGVAIFLTICDRSITELFLSVPAIMNHLDELVLVKDQIMKFKMHLVKDDPIVTFDNYSHFEEQSRELFNESVIVYENGGHELIPDFLRFLK